MNHEPGTSNHENYVNPVNQFQKRSMKDLVKMIPECEGSKWVENMNEVFGLVDEKMGLMMRVMTNLACQEASGILFTPSEVLKRVISDCQGIRSLMVVQKKKLAAIKHEHPKVMDAAEIKKEASILKKFFYAKRNLPTNPFLSLEPENKKRKLNDMLIGNAYQSVYREFLLYPSPMMKRSEFISFMHALPGPNRFTEEQVHHVIVELNKRDLIKGFICDNGTDYMIIKQLCIASIENRLKAFAVTEDEYMTNNVPKSLSELREIVGRFDDQVLRKVDNDLWAIVVTMIIATVVRDPVTLIDSADFPEKLLNSVIRVTSILCSIGFLEEFAQKTKFEKRVNPKTVSSLRHLVEIQWCLKNASKDP